MRIIDSKKIDTNRHNKVTFIRVEPVDLQTTLTDIINTLSDLSWISRFDDEFLRASFNARAMPTIADIVRKLQASSLDEVSCDAGEYVVSELSRKAIVTQLNYANIPISELYSKKVSGNPGFDYHTQNDCETLIFGEAKYVNDKNAYGTGLKQVAEFICAEKDLKDLADLRDFFSNTVLKKVVQGRKGFAVGFSAKSTSSDTLIKNIIQNAHYNNLLLYDEIVLVAVNI